MMVKSKKFKILLGIGVLVVVLAVGGWLLFRLHLSWLSIDDDLGVVFTYHEGDATFTYDNNGMFDIVFHTKEPVVYIGNERMVMRDGIRVRNGRPYINMRDLWVVGPNALDHIIEADTSSPVAVIVNGLYGQGTQEQNEMIHSLLGGELARDRFELYFQWYNTIHELGHMITHSNGTVQSRHMVEEEMLANSFAIAFWTYFGEEEKLYALEETVEYILSNITPPAENVHHLDFMREAVDTGRFAEVFTFEIYGWFQFSIVRDILRDRDSLNLAQLLTEMTDSENIQAQPRQRLVYQSLGTDIVPIIVGDAISILENWGVENLPDVYIAFSTDPNAHMYQYPMPRSLLEPNIEAGRVLRVRSLWADETEQIMAMTFQ
ncbi:MAG: hypothetical protein FWE05_02160 [Defluviitaleaceae bacterium]|nr:hypothetical protein [Defluviitaleaceae bacterium]